MPGSRVALLVALVGTAALGLFVLDEHYGKRDLERAVIAVRTERFGGTTRARIGPWLKAHHPNARLEWHAESLGLFTDDVDVTLQVGDGMKLQFRVAVSSKSVTPRNEETARLIQLIKEWARE